MVAENVLGLTQSMPTKQRVRYSKYGSQVSTLLGTKLGCSQVSIDLMLHLALCASHANIKVSKRDKVMKKKDSRNL